MEIFVMQFPYIALLGVLSSWLFSVYSHFPLWFNEIIGILGELSGKLQNYLLYTKELIYFGVKNVKSKTLLGITSILLYNYFFFTAIFANR